MWKISDFVVYIVLYCSLLVQKYHGPENVYHLDIIECQCLVGIETLMLSESLQFKSLLID